VASYTVMSQHDAASPGLTLLRVLCCATLRDYVQTTDGMATIGEELSDEEGGLRAGGPSSGAHKSLESGSGQYQDAADEHDFDSMRGSM
jgi:hypothetical protein